tara:strand:- start:374 stop:1057 length:684 start_codon:yes stop_codon:yes gene_type:complete
MIELEHLIYHETGQGFPDEVVCMRPFGPAIGHATIPKDIIDAFNADIDGGTEGPDWSEKLVGKVESENLIPTDVLEPHSRFFTDTALRYVDNYAERHCKPIAEDIKPVVQIQSAWYVQQKAADFNPIHLHTNAELSCVGYLKMPEDIQEEWKEDDKDHYPAAGHIEFMHGSPTFMNRPTFMVRPKVGDFFIFPADLQHTVYPFKSSGERRSFSMNIILAEKEEEGGD